MDDRKMMKKTLFASCLDIPVIHFPVEIDGFAESRAAP
jgi:hypothetical protein